MLLGLWITVGFGQPKIDDPDEEVFGAVSNKIVDYGKTIIPSLEHLWETTISEEVQGRIELLIHRLHYTDLTEDFRQWGLSGHHDAGERRER